MAVDNAKNFAKATLASGITAGATSLSVVSGQGARLPVAPYNATIWNAADYPDPSDDPDVEIVRVTGGTDTLTITRAQEGTSAAAHNTVGKTYKLLAALTAKVINTDLPALVGGTGEPNTVLLSSYNASGSKVTTTGSITVGSNALTVASASSFQVNHGIYVAGAGATGALVTRIIAIAGNIFTLLDQAAMTVSNVLVQHDDTVAIQNAMDAVCAAGTGTIKAAAGFYRVNGPFQSTNSILKIPLNSIAGAGPTKAISIIGPPNPMPGWIGTPSEYGMVIQSDKTGLTAESSILAAASFNAGDPNSGNATAVYLENITFRTYNNPQISGVDMGMAANFLAQNVVIDAGVTYTAASEPTRQCFALRCATNNVTSCHKLDYVSVGNYWYGIIFTEETVFVWANAACCKVAARADFGFHPASGHLVLWGCPTVLEFTGRLAVDLRIDYEEAISGWFIPIDGRDVYDPTDQAQGLIRFHKTQGSTGNVLPVEVTGGTDLSILSMNGLPARFNEITTRTLDVTSHQTVSMLDVNDTLRMVDGSMTLSLLGFGADNSGGAGYKQVIAQNTPTGTLSTGLVAVWLLNEVSGTRSDSIGTNHLTDHNGVTQASGPAPAGLWAQFTAASSQYLSSASNAALAVGDEDFTFGVWLSLTNFPAFDAAYSIIGKESSTSRDYAMDLYFHGSGEKRFRFFTGHPSPALVETTFPFAPAINTRYLVLGWHDASLNTIYLQINDNVPLSTAMGSVVPSDAVSEFRIGARDVAIPGFFNGRIGPVYFWNRILTALERNSLYNGGDGVAFPFS